MKVRLLKIHRKDKVTANPRKKPGAPGLFALIEAAGWPIWFLIVDTVNGRPLYTPTVLGTALFGGGAGLETPETLQPSFEMAFSFTWVHVLVFLVIGVGLTLRRRRD